MYHKRAFGLQVGSASFCVANKTSQTMMYTNPQVERDDATSGEEHTVMNPTALGGAKDDILEATPSFKRHEVDDSDASNKTKGLGFNINQKVNAKKRRIGEIASVAPGDQQNFLPPNNFVLQDDALRAISKGQSNQGSVFNLNQNSIGKLSIARVGSARDAVSGRRLHLLV